MKPNLYRINSLSCCLTYVLIETAAAALCTGTASVLLYTAALCDLYTGMIPDLCSAGILVEGIASHGCAHLIPALLLSLVLGVFAYYHMFGWGDVKLIGAFAVLCGTDTLYGLLLASSVCLCFNVWKKESPDAEIPFAPYLWIGFMLVLSAGA